MTTVALNLESLRLSGDFYLALEELITDKPLEELGQLPFGKFLDLCEDYNIRFTHDTQEHAADTAYGSLVLAVIASGGRKEYVEEYMPLQPVGVVIPSLAVNGILPIRNTSF